MDMNSALAAHQEWKIKLRGAISAKSQLDAMTIRRDDCCALGKWLYGEAKAQYAAVPAYRECVAAHTAFHQEAGKVAALINAQNYAQAEKALGAGSTYAAASDTVGGAIMRMRRQMAA